MHNFLKGVLATLPPGVNFIQTGGRALRNDIVTSFLKYTACHESLVQIATALIIA